MLNALFAEEVRADRLRRVAFKKFEEPRLGRARAKFKEGTIDMFDVLQFASKVTSSLNDKSYREARRERLRAWYKKHGGGFELDKDYFRGDFGEAERLKQLKDMRVMLSMMNWDADVDGGKALNDSEEDEIDFEDETLSWYENEDELNIDNLDKEHRRVEEEDARRLNERQRQEADTEFV